MRNTIFINGDIITVDDTLQNAEAIVVKYGKIIYVGSTTEALKHKHLFSKVIDLKGKTMLPGFIDSHSHFMFSSQLSQFINLSPPPIGEISTITDIINKFKTTINAQNLKPGSLVLGFGYDDSLIKDKRPITKNDLDKISTKHLIYAIHQSAHSAVANSAVLSKFNVTERTPDPEGGHFGRIKGTQIPNGILEEKAHMNIFMNIMSKPSLPSLFESIKGGVKEYAQYGITTAQDGGLNKQVINGLNFFNKLGLLKLDIIGYYMINQIDDFAELDNLSNLNKYNKRFKVGGAKVLLDGSPQAKTAWLSQPYYIAPEGRSDDYCGYPIYEDDNFVTKIYEECLKREIQVLTHTNGDQASEQLLNCFEKAKENLISSCDTRPVMIHAQTVREDQLDRMKTLKMIPSFFQVHTYFWGDWHINSVLGKERAYRISPVQSTIKRDMVYTLHQDSPVVPPNMLFTVWSAVNRQTRSGEIIGPEQRITVIEAIKGITINAAYQYFEENSKGSISVGKRADLVILDQNPLKVDVNAIKDIKVLETIKDGVTIYKLKN